MDLSLEEKLLTDVRQRIQTLRDKEITGLAMNEEAELSDLESQELYLSNIVDAKKKEQEHQEQNQQTIQQEEQPTNPNLQTDTNQWTPVTPTNYTSQSEQLPEETSITLDSTLYNINLLIESLDQYKKTNKINREFSLAITKLEESAMWLEKSKQKKD